MDGTLHLPPTPTLVEICVPDQNTHAKKAIYSNVSVGLHATRCWPL